MLLVVKKIFCKVFGTKNRDGKSFLDIGVKPIDTRETFQSIASGREIPEKRSTDIL